MLVYIEPYKLQVLPGSVNLTNPTPTVDYSSTFTVPAGVYTITVTIIGGGGGGGGEQDGCTGGAGGGGGGWRVETISVTPGQVIPYTIGKRGEGGHYRPIGTDYPARTGGDTTFAGFTSTGGGPGKSVRYEGGTGGPGGVPNGQPGTNGTGGHGGGCGPGNIYGVGGTSTSILPTGNGSGGGGTTGCYNFNCGDDSGCPGTTGAIIVSWTGN